MMLHMTSMMTTSLGQPDPGQAPNPAGQGGTLFGATHVKDTGKMIAEELIAYIEKQSVVKTTRDDRIKVLAFE